MLLLGLYWCQQAYVDWNNRPVLTTIKTTGLPIKEVDIFTCLGHRTCITLIGRPPPPQPPDIFRFKLLACSIFAFQFLMHVLSRSIFTPKIYADIMQQQYHVVYMIYIYRLGGSNWGLVRAWVGAWRVAWCGAWCGCGGGGCGGGVVMCGGGGIACHPKPQPDPP